MGEVFLAVEVFQRDVRPFFFDQPAHAQAAVTLVGDLAHRVHAGARVVAVADVGGEQLVDLVQGHGEQVTIHRPGT